MMFEIYFYKVLHYIRLNCKNQQPLDISVTSMLQVNDYIMQPDTSLLADQVKTCLQESDEVPHDITSLFDSSLFKLDTSIVPRAIK